MTVATLQFGSHSKNSTENHATSEARTSTLTAGKDLTILATDGSITSQGTQMSAEGNALLLAKDSIKLDVAHSTETKSQDSKTSGFSFDNRTAMMAGTLHNKSNGNGATDTVTGTTLSAGGSATVATQTGDITLTGANVASEGQLAINSARNLTITSAQDTVRNANQSDNKAIGKVVISDTERFAGYHNEKHLDNGNEVKQVASNVGSLKGDVVLSAGEKYTQTSSNVTAGNDVSITAKTIDINTLDNTGSNQTANSDLKIGAFARISSPLIDLANNVEAARKSDGRLKEMQRMAAAANGYQAASAIRSMTGGAGSGILVKGEAGIGFASSSDSSNGNGSTAQGSAINGGRNVTLTATGGDIHATGATLNASKTLSLDAAQNIVLDASQSTLHSDGKNKSSGVEAGVGFQVGAQTGVYIYAAANVGKGHNKNDSTINNNTQLNADTINIRSKGDTTLKGATATANTINTDVGGKLAIESLQDTSQFESVQTNAGVRVQVAIGNAWSASGNLSQQKGSGTYAGVGQQSGLFAGEGGYHIKADTIDLKGGAIASTNAAASELTTNKLTTSNIENKMTYSASNVSMAGGTGGKSELLRDDAGKILPLSQQNQTFGTAKDGNVAPGLPMVQKGSDSSTTYATVTDGKITIGGVTTSSVKDLGINTDLSKANTALDKLPDLQKLLKDQQAMSAAAGTVIATGKQFAGDIAGNAAKAQKAAQETLNDPKSTAEQKLAAAKANEEAQQTLKDWGTGGIYSRALNAGVGILTGALAGQGGGQITSNAIAPTVAKIVGDIGTDLQKEARNEADKFAALAQQAADRGDTAAAAEYSAKANEAATTAANWGDNGIYRVGLHAATQGMLGGLANGQSGALESAAGVVGGNLGQQLGAQLGNAEANKLGLKGEEKRAFVNAFQQTGAAVGGMVAGAVAGSVSDGSVDVGSVLAAAQGGEAAGTVDVFNRQQHWSSFLKDVKACSKDPQASGCDVLLKMVPSKSRLLESAVASTSNVAVNTDAAGKVVSYTIFDKATNQPVLIMEPQDFEAFKNMSPARQTILKNTPDFALDYVSTKLDQRAEPVKPVVQEGNEQGFGQKVSNFLGQANRMWGVFDFMKVSQESVESGVRGHLFGPCFQGFQDCGGHEVLVRTTTDNMKGGADGIVEGANRYYPALAQNVVFAAAPEAAAGFLEARLATQSIRVATAENGGLGFGRSTFQQGETGLTTGPARIDSGGGISVTPPSTENFNALNGAKIADASPGPVSFTREGDEFFKNASMRPDVDVNGTFDVVAHGSTHKIEVMTPSGTVMVDQRVAAKLIENSPGYNGQPIRLLSCETGACDAGFAQNLANKLGVRVTAPTDLVWAYGDGKLVVAPRLSNDPKSLLFNYPDLSKQGTFRTFEPGGNK